MNIQQILTPEDYKLALNRLDEIWPEPGTLANKEFEALAILVDTYEEAMFPIGDFSNFLKQQPGTK